MKTLIQVMVLVPTGNKLLSEPCYQSYLMPCGAKRPQWVLELWEQFCELIISLTAGRCGYNPKLAIFHYCDVIMGAVASQITSLTIVYWTVYSDEDQRKYQSSASPAFLRGIHRGPVNSAHKWPVTRKMFPFDDVIMQTPHNDIYCIL